MILTLLVIAGASAFSFVGLVASKIAYKKYYTISNFDGELIAVFSFFVWPLAVPIFIMSKKADEVIKYLDERKDKKRLPEATIENK